MLPKARIPDPGPKALESIRLSVFVPGGKTAGHHPTSGWHDLEDHGGGENKCTRKEKSVNRIFFLSLTTTLWTTSMTLRWWSVVVSEEEAVNLYFSFRTPSIS